MTALGIFLAPDGTASGVLDVLTDLSAAGLIEPFLWVRPAQVTSGAAQGVLVSAGRRRPSGLQDALAREDHTRIRLCVLVPLSGAERVSPEAEQDFAGLVTELADLTPLTRIRCILARPPADHAPATDLERHGWHNIVLAPEDRNGPSTKPWLLTSTTDPVEIGRHAAPFIAGLMGLWSTVPTTPLDELQATPGLRVGRTFYRYVDARMVEQELRWQVLTTEPELPRPTSGRLRAVYQEDAAAACAYMEAKWWEKNWRSLVSERVVAKRATSEHLDWRSALRWLFRFVWEALKGWPGNLSRSMKHSAAEAAARKVQGIVFGPGQSAYTVVVNGRTADGLQAGLEDLLAGVHELDQHLTAAGEYQPPPRGEQKVIWADFVYGALTLADAGQRGGTEMPALDVNGSPAVLRSVTDCAPSAEHDFVVESGRLAASLGRGVSRVAPGDIRGARQLSDKLHRAGQDLSLSTAVDETSSALTRWQERYRHTYSGLVGWKVYGNIEHACRQVMEYLAELIRLAEEAKNLREQDMSKLVFWVRMLLAVAVVAMVVAPILYSKQLVTGWWALGIGAVPLLVWAVFAAVRFIREQRDLFRLRYLSEQLVNDVEAARRNLALAMYDVRRLTEGYERYLIWSRIVGEFLHSPFGPRPPAVEEAVHIAFGLPRATQTADAEVVEETLRQAVSQLRTEQFAAGWLAGPWEKLWQGAGAQLGRNELVDEPDRIFELESAAPGSDLADWAAHLTKNGTSAATGEAVWKSTRDLLDGDRVDVKTLLMGSVRNAGDEESRTPLSEFFRGVDQQTAGTDEQVNGKVFIPQARVAGSARIAVNRSYRIRNGLSEVAVLVQMTDAYPVYDYAILSPDVDDDDDSNRSGSW